MHNFPTSLGPSSPYIEKTGELYGNLNKIIIILCVGGRYPYVHGKLIVLNTTSIVTIEGMGFRKTGMGNAPIFNGPSSSLRKYIYVVLRQREWPIEYLDALLKT